MAPSLINELGTYKQKEERSYVLENDDENDDENIEENDDENDDENAEENENEQERRIPNADVKPLKRGTHYFSITSDNIGTVTFSMQYFTSRRVV